MTPIIVSEVLPYRDPIMVPPFIGNVPSGFERNALNTFPGIMAVPVTVNGIFKLSTKQYLPETLGPILIMDWVTMEVRLKLGLDIRMASPFQLPEMGA